MVPVPSINLRRLCMKLQNLLDSSLQEENGKSGSDEKCPRKEKAAMDCSA